MPFRRHYHIFRAPDKNFQLCLRRRLFLRLRPRQAEVSEDEKWRKVAGSHFQFQQKSEKVYSNTKRTTGETDQFL